MDIEYLREFIVMAAKSNYTEAAETLYISQSSLFKHVKSLESELGVPLFKKTGRSIEITQYGKIFLKYANQITRTADECIDELQRATGSRAKLIRVGYQYKITDLVRDFCLSHKGYEVTLTQHAKSPINELRDGNCDLIIVLLGAQTDEENEMLRNLDVIPIRNDSMAVILPPDHQLAGRSSIKPQEIRNENFVLPNSSDEITKTLFKKLGFTPKVTMNAVTGDEAARLVSSGLGISILHRSTIEQEFTHGEVSIAELDPKFGLMLAICSPSDKELNPACMQFLQFAVQYYQNDRK